MKNNFLKYLWLLPGLYVVFEFTSKLFEVIQDSEEFVSIINVINFLKPFSTLLAYGVGVLDFVIGCLLLVNYFFFKNRKLQLNLFLWTIFWPLIPASIRYFGGVGEFEIYVVSSMMASSILALALWYKYN